MTTIVIKGSTLVKKAPKNAVTRIQNQLCFDNPAYLEAKKAKRYISEDMPKKIMYYKMQGSSIIIPRAMTSIAAKAAGVGIEEIIDRTVAPPIEINFTGTPRDYQEKAIEAILKKRYGILEAGTGGGKTIMGIAIAARRGVRTLVIVHNKELLQQWVDSIKKFTDINEVGVIGDGKFQVRDVTVGIINSVNNKVVPQDLEDEVAKEHSKVRASNIRVAKKAHKENRDAPEKKKPKAREEIKQLVEKHNETSKWLQKHFGFVIYDECHRTVGDSWVQVINTMYPKYHLGLTATPYRSDGLTEVLYRLVGPVRHSVDRDHLEDTGAIMVPRILRINTNLAYNFNNDYAQMLSALVANDDRNLLIANCIIKDFKRNKEPIMVVSDRVAHCEVLKYLIDGEAGVYPLVLSGRLDKGYRKRVMVDFKAGEYNVLIATVSLLGEGFDAPDLNSVFLTTPLKFKGRVIQTIGRVLRPSEGGVQPRVVDFRDVLIPVLRYSGFARDRVYKKYNWK